MHLGRRVDQFDQVLVGLIGASSRAADVSPGLVIILIKNSSLFDEDQTNLLILNNRFTALTRQIHLKMTRQSQQ